MRHILKKITLYSVSFLIGALLFYAFLRVGNISVVDIFRPFESMRPWHIVVFLLITFVSWMIYVFRWKLILRDQGFDKIPLLTLFWAKMSGFAFGYVTPSAQLGGEPLRAYVLKREANIPVVKGLSSIILDKSMQFVLNIVFVVLSFLFFIFFFDIPFKWLIILLSVVFVFSVVFIVVGHRMMFNKGVFSTIMKFFGLHRLKFFRWVMRAVKSVECDISVFMKYRRGGIFKGLILTTVGFFWMLLQYKFALYMIGYHDVNLFVVFFILVAAALAYIFPVPAAIGVLEGGQIIVFHLVGLPTSAAVSLVIIIRTFDILYVILGFVYLSYHGANFTRGFLQNGVDVNACDDDTKED